MFATLSPTYCLFLLPFPTCQLSSAILDNIRSFNCEIANQRSINHSLWINSKFEFMLIGLFTDGRADVSIVHLDGTVDIKVCGVNSCLNWLVWLVPKLMILIDHNIDDNSFYNYEAHYSDWEVWTERFSRIPSGPSRTTNKFRYLVSLFSFDI